MHVLIPHVCKLAGKKQLFIPEMLQFYVGRVTTQLWQSQHTWVHLQGAQVGTRPQGLLCSSSIWSWACLLGDVTKEKLLEIATRSRKSGSGNWMQSDNPQL